MTTKPKLCPDTLRWIADGLTRMADSFYAKNVSARHCGNSHDADIYADSMNAIKHEQKRLRNLATRAEKAQ